MSDLDPKLALASSILELSYPRSEAGVYAKVTPDTVHACSFSGL